MQGRHLARQVCGKQELGNAGAWQGRYVTSWHLARQALGTAGMSHVARQALGKADTSLGRYVDMHALGKAVMWKASTWQAATWRGRHSSRQVCNLVSPCQWFSGCVVLQVCTFACNVVAPNQWCSSKVVITSMQTCTHCYIYLTNETIGLLTLERMQASMHLHSHPTTETTHVHVVPRREGLEAPDGVCPLSNARESEYRCIPACVFACCLPVCLYVCLRVCIDACLYVCLPVCVYACLPLWPAGFFWYVSVCVCVLCVYVRMCVCVCV